MAGKYRQLPLVFLYLVLILGNKNHLTHLLLVTCRGPNLPNRCWNLDTEAVNMHLLLDLVLLMEMFPTSSFSSHHPLSWPCHLESAAGLLWRPVPNLFQLQRATLADGYVLEDATSLQMLVFSFPSNMSQCMSDSVDIWRLLSCLSFWTP